MNSARSNSRPAKKGPACIWMQAGVVRRRYCRSDYQCPACSFDRAMRRTALANRRMRENGVSPTGGRGKIVFWKDRLRAQAPWKQPCLHHMKGRIEFRACTNDYRCGKCEFDQYFSDQFAVHTVVRPVDVLQVKGFKIPQGYYLHRGHGWAKIEDGAMVRIGLDDFALRLLGPLNRIQAPLVGKAVKQDRRDIVVRRGSKTARLRSPVSGVVTDINPALREKWRLANEDPYSRGWVLRLHADNLRPELKHLMIGEQAGRFLDDEIEQLYRVIEREAGLLAADGGHLADDIYGNLPQIGWQKLIRLFLRT